jgi:hypothetical protein
VIIRGVAFTERPAYGGHQQPDHQHDLANEGTEASSKAYVRYSTLPKLSMRQPTPTLMTRGMKPEVSATDNAIERLCDDGRHGAAHQH